MKKMVKVMSGYLALQRKFLNSEVQNAVLLQSWQTRNPTTTLSLSIPPEGVGETERIGKEYAIESIYMNFEVSQATQEAVSDPPPVTYVRVIVYLDTQTNSTEANASDIMDDTGTRDILAFRNMDFTKRFSVLFDKKVRLGNEGMTADSANDFDLGFKSTYFSYMKKFKTAIKVRCDNAAALITSCVTNNIGVIAICDRIDNAPVLSYQCRIRFRG